MKIHSLILCASLLLGTTIAASAQQSQDKAANMEKETTRKGLFTVSHKSSEWYFTIPDSLIGRRFLATVRFTSTPAETGKYGGESVNDQMVYWQLTPDGSTLLLRSELLINNADSVDNINRAVTISNENPIIGSFKAERKANGYRINVTRFFMEDNPALGIPSYLKGRWGLQAFNSSSSYIESIKTFPENTEIRTIKTWNSASGNTQAAAYTGKVTIGLNVSFILLPKEPMMGRLFDPRVGYFTDSHNYYADHQQSVTQRRLITRWRLEPKNEADRERMKRGELVEPKKPIVFYIDPATPAQWRPYLIQGVNDWQVAFERAGFKNAIIGKEWPENDSTMSMEDARFSVIRYLASPIPNAYGPHIHDPRSGEILESHICWYHNVMTLVHDWYMVQAGTIDEAAQRMQYDEELMGQLIRFVSSHEVGHTLGLRHNFGASATVPVDSLRSKEWVEKYGHTPSIMDYARFNYVAQPEDSITRAGIFPRINDYDLWAIEWGYSPMWNAYDEESDHWELEKLTAKRLKNQPRLWFGDGETNRTNDSRCQTEDLGDDAMKASEYGILNIKRALRELPQWTYASNDIHGQNLRKMYSQYISQIVRYCGHVLGNIGGVYYNYKTVDEPGNLFANAPRSKQQDAFDFLRRHILNEPTWLINQDYIRRLTPKPEAVTKDLGKSIAAQMFSSNILNRLTPEYSAEDYLCDIEREIFRKVASGQKISEYEQMIQAQYIESMCRYIKDLPFTSPAYAPILAHLTALQPRMERAGKAVANNTATRAHYLSLARHIESTLKIE